MTLSQALALAEDRDLLPESEIWVQSSTFVLGPQMPATIAIGMSLVDHLDSTWHLVCLACNVSDFSFD